MTKLSIATALLLGTAVFATAADNLASAFKEGKFDGNPADIKITIEPL